MKKDLGLFCFLVCLCVVVMGIQIERQFQEGRSWAQLETPQLISADNLANTANTIGRFGVFSIGIGIVIITSGIDACTCGRIAINGIDRLALAMAVSGPGCHCTSDGTWFLSWLAGDSHATPTFYRDAMRPVDLPRLGALAGQ